MKNTSIYIFLAVGSILMSCSSRKPASSGTKPSVFDFEAHRGGRGLMPENTIAAMKNAIDLNATTLELDLQISKDKKVVVSHDSYFHNLFSTTPSGGYLTPQQARKTLLYSMTYDSIRKYDVGLKPHPDFPRQKKVAAVKPLLTALIDSAGAYAASKGRKMQYNMEIKSNKANDNVYHPEPQEFVDLVIGVLKQKNLIDRTIIQSFDIRPLQIIHRLYPRVRLSYLVDKKTGELAQNLKSLGFNPAVYSPESSIVTKEMVDACHQRNIKVIPWTVNEEDAIRSLMKMGVDGIISDYPDLFNKINGK